MGKEEEEENSTWWRRKERGGEEEFGLREGKDSTHLVEGNTKTAMLNEQRSLQLD